MVAYRSAMICWIEGSIRRIEHIQNQICYVYFEVTQIRVLAEQQFERS